MLNVQPLSQRDPRWKDKKLGFSSYTIGSKGCTVTAFTMLVNYVYGSIFGVDQVNDKLKEFDAFAKDQYGQKSLLIWYKGAQAYPKLKWIERLVNYNNVKTWWYINIHKIPVCVEVNAWSIGAPRHWVLFCGDQKCADPWTGAIISTSKYPATGDALFQKA
jgi:hypothetical protein